jgi:hypothetical protein
MSMKITANTIVNGIAIRIMTQLFDSEVTLSCRVYAPKAAVIYDFILDEAGMHRVFRTNLIYMDTFKGVINLNCFSIISIIVRGAGSNN